MRHVTTIDSRRWLAVGTIIAAVATGGSLWLSFGLGLVPCELCWYQRILMYPLVVILGVATIEGRPLVYRTAFPLAVGGVLIAGYHSWIQYTGAPTACSVGQISCGIVQYRIGGITVPNLSLTAFVLITAVLFVIARWSK
ncbi:disulfide bond formation protein DsbB [Haladaptatus sp. R4]|uniref:disulfide bond formation protein B n=1 Tax=Haladaptatus sp. R4 TaxID=1679489 RepID=UPI0007B48F57|nr:disulfide bond formation protein B [Haladaptatus sp. R4]KZN23281.1 disulfide bond formation protein DsbB [Haladaptatus sp. R4]